MVFHVIFTNVVCDMFDLFRNKKKTMKFGADPSNVHFVNSVMIQFREDNPKISGTMSHLRIAVQSPAIRIPMVELVSLQDFLGESVFLPGFPW